MIKIKKTVTILGLAEELLSFCNLEKIYYFFDVKGGDEMYIKIYTKSQLVLLRRLQPLFRKKYKIPREILKRVYQILKNRNLGRNGYIAIVLKPITDDMIEIKDILDCYPRKFHGGEDIVDVPVNDNKQWLTKGREWYMDILFSKEDKSYVYVIYSMTLKDVEF